MTVTAACGAILEGVALPPHSKEKIERRHTESGKRETTLGELLRLSLLSMCGAEDEPIAVGEHGKPYLPARPDIKYNISHSRNLAAGIVMTGASTEDVGCDVEYIKRDIDEGKLRRIMRRFYTDGERDSVMSASDQIREFFRIWTRKEAYIKYTGEGMSCPLRSFDTTRDVDGVKLFSYTVTDSDGEEYALSFCVTAGREKELHDPCRIENFNTNEH